MHISKKEMHVSKMEIHISKMEMQISKAGMHEGGSRMCVAPTMHSGSDQARCLRHSRRRHLRRRHLRRGAPLHSIGVGSQSRRSSYQRSPLIFYGSHGRNSSKPPLALGWQTPPPNRPPPAISPSSTPTATPPIAPPPPPPISPRFADANLLRCAFVQRYASGCHSGGGSRRGSRRGSRGASRRGSRGISRRGPSEVSSEVSAGLESEQQVFFISPPRHPFLPYVAHPFSPYLRIKSFLAPRVPWGCRDRARHLFAALPPF